MNSLKILFSAILLIALSGCDEIDGQLQVNQAINLKAGKKTVTLAQGLYDAQLEPKSATKVNLEVKIGKDKKDFSFQVSKGKKLIADDGQINIAARESGQAYDVLGQQQINVSNSESIRTWESCTFSIQEYRCHREAFPETCNDDGRGHRRCRGGGFRQVCGNETVFVSGRQDVEYYIRTTVTSVALDLVVPNSSDAVAHFSGSRAENERIYTYRGFCGR